MKIFAKIGFCLFVFTLLGFFSFVLVNKVEAAPTCDAITTGNWNTPATWSGACTGPDGIPGGADSARISSNVFVTIDTAGAVAASLTLPTLSASESSGLTIISPGTLATGIISIAGSIDTTSSIIDVGDGTLSVSNIILNGNVTDGDSIITVGTGTLDVSGSITFNGVQTQIDQLISTDDGIIKIGGSLDWDGTVTTSGTGTINFNGAGAQTIPDYSTYNNLIFSGGGTKSFSANTTINGNLTIESGTIANLVLTSPTTTTLYFDGAYQPAGTYGPVGSGADFENDTYFAGSGGLLTVLELGGVEFSGAGTGVEGDPYIITSCAELMEVNNFLDAYFQLDGGISGGILDCTANANDIMIGSAGDPFTGNFDGNSIKVNIDIEAVDDYAGLFRYVSDASITNLGAGGTVIGTNYVGGIIGYGENSQIDNSYSQVNVTGTGEYIGGFLGYIEGGTITDSYATGLITGGSENIGGFAGEVDGASTISESYAIGNVSSSDPEAIDMGGFAGDIDNSVVTASYATGSVTGESYIGGFVGDSDTNAEFYQSYATGTVTGTGENIGGFIGDIENGLIQDSYSLSTVVGADDTGGFVGDAADSTIVHSYSAGAVSGSGEVGGFLGEDEINNTFSMSFFDTETSGLENACGDSSCTGVTGETTENMKNIYTFNPYSEDGYGFSLEEAAIYRYVKWDITTVRDGSDTDCYTGDVCTQASEFSLMLDGFDLVLDGITVTNPGGVNPFGSEANKLIDGDTATKFLDAAFSSDNSSFGSTSVIFDAGIGESFEFNGYDWATGNDMITRDAISWTVSGSDDGVSYTVLDTQTIYSTTTDRQTFVVGTENENWDFYTIWAITADDNDGYPFLQQLIDSPYEYEEQIAPYVITEVTPAPVNTIDTTVIYHFAITGEGDAALVVSDGCGNNVSATELGSDPDDQQVQFASLEAGETYECSIFVRSDAGDSNELIVGPFTVRRSSVSGSSPNRTIVNQIFSIPTTITETLLIPKFTFTKDLKFRMVDIEVQELQKFLNNNGYLVSTEGAGSKGLETTLFGAKTRAALIAFQKANNITPAVGYFGPITRAKVNSLISAQ